MRIMIDSRDTEDLKSVGRSQQLLMTRIKFDTLSTDERYAQ